MRSALRGSCLALMTSENSKAPQFSTRQKLILTGLYLSKFDSEGLRSLGFESFTEAFNVIGYALGARPASIKNYRDEFDPLFPNPRSGWHKRATREYCIEVMQQFGSLNLSDFTGLVSSFFGFQASADQLTLKPEQIAEGDSAFAKRLMTGLAAERYFESVHAGISQFQGFLIENTTGYGCGYDFRLRRDPKDELFMAVEVKGLSERSGTVAMTPKEYATASLLTDRFFLFVVRNFREKPSHAIYQNPISSDLLHFSKFERIIVQTSWVTQV